MTQWLIRLFVKNPDNTQDNAVRAAYASLGAGVGILVNLLLAAGKFLMGLISKSLAITADAANNLSDAAGSIVALVSTRAAQRPVDEEPPFGHGRMEYLGSLAVGVLILVMAISLLKDGISKMPPEINHLRLGGSIANPMNIRLGRGLTFPGMREDSVRLTAEIVEIHEKASAPKGATKNWAGQVVQQVDKGRRLRAILAVGSQDISDAKTLIPEEEGVEIIGGSSDHTIVDVTDSGKTWKSGDTLSFKVRYANMLYAFSGDHVSIYYTHDTN